jgi:hypothetical protein
MQNSIEKKNRGTSSIQLNILILQLTVYSILDSLCVLGVLSLGSLVCTPVYPSMWTGYSSASTDTSTLPRWRLSVVEYLYASHKFYLINKSDQNRSFPLIGTNFTCTYVKGDGIMGINFVVRSII